MTIRSLLPAMLVLLGTLWLSKLHHQLHAQSANTKPMGVDCSYVGEMERQGKNWHDDDGKIDPFQRLAKQGCNYARIRLWVGEDGMSRLMDATALARRGQAAGLQPYLVIFLSDDWADFEKQPVPQRWKDLNLEQKCAAVTAYCAMIMEHFAREKIKLELVEIGNEIDFGICGEFESEWPKRVSLEYMRLRIWPNVAKVIAAAQKGVQKIQPQTRFIIHLTQWNNINYCISYWQFMREHGVAIDVPGISYFPTSDADATHRTFGFLQQQLEVATKAMGKPVMICETGYPCTSDFGGQFATWKHPAPDYPLTEAGQTRWIVDLFKLARQDQNCAGVIYWSPEWYGGGIWDAFACFDSAGKARPALGSLSAHGAR